jgi:predicted RNA-binding protein with PIN domain
MLPAEVRQQLVTMAADLIGRRPVTELPATVRRFARFAPAKRLRLGASELAAALAVDEGFRQLVADVVTESSPELVEQVSAGRPPATADPVDVAVIAYLLRPPGWAQLLTGIGDQLAEAGQRREVDVDLNRLRAEVGRLTETNAALVRDRDAARAAMKAATAEQLVQVEDSRRRSRTLQGELKAAQRAHAQASAELDRLRTEVERRTATETQELRRARARIGVLEAGLEADRRSARTAREHDDARLWVLLETIGAAAAGLRRELDISEPSVRPADIVESAVTEAAGRLSSVDQPLLERLLDGGHVHLIVDGYNLTKSGYGSLPLADQRTRLVASLGPLAARTSAEITVAFDGTAAPVGAAATLSTPRGVRVLFSASGQLADDLIRDLLHAEPPGRTVLVASSDQEVAASARTAGAWPVPATVLLTRLERS